MKIRNDFVTNSSSSCFVVETGESMATVKKALQRILKGYGIMLDADVLAYDDVFQEPYVYTQERHDENVAECERYKWDSMCWNYQSQDNVGKVLIMSADDNSVPWDICEIIENRFQTRREHLG